MDWEEIARVASRQAIELEKENERLVDALGLLRGYVTDDEGWRIINEALAGER